MATARLSRPENDKSFRQDAKDKDMMSYMVFFQVSEREAYLRFHPTEVDVLTGSLDAHGAECCRQFFAKQENKQYVKAFRKTLKARLAGLDIKEEEEDSNIISDKRKDEALKSLFDKAMTLVEGSGELDADTLKIAAEIFRKIGLLKDEVETLEAPRRYLPERCCDCRYREFVESHIASGDIEVKKE